MEAILIGLAALLVGLVGGALAPRMKAAKAVLIIASISCVLAIIFGLLIVSSDHFDHYFSLEVQFWSSVGIGYGLLSAGLLTTGLLLCEVARTKKSFYALAALLFALGVPMVYGKVFCGAVSSIGAARNKNGITLQTTGFTCTAASVSNLGRVYGRAVSEREAAELMRLNIWGGSVYQIAHALGLLNFAFEEISQKKINDIIFPAILIVDWGPQPDGHAILVTGRNGLKYDVVDPLGSKAPRSAEWFDRAWRGKGVMHIRPTTEP